MKFKPTPNPNISKREFYLRSFTWGLPVNIGGAVFAFLLLLTGHRPKKFGHCIHFETGKKKWGGGSLGIFMFTCKNATLHLKAHEHGHSIQNCFYGPFMPFIVNIPSSLRFWVRKLLKKIFPKIRLRPYDSAWFEAEASSLGHEFLKNL